MNDNTFERTITRFAVNMERGLLLDFKKVCLDLEVSYSEAFSRLARLVVKKRELPPAEEVLDL